MVKGGTKQKLLAAWSRTSSEFYSCKFSTVMHQTMQNGWLEISNVTIYLWLSDINLNQNYLYIYIYIAIFDFNEMQTWKIEISKKSWVPNPSHCTPKGPPRGHCTGQRQTFVVLRPQDCDGKVMPRLQGRIGRKYQLHEWAIVWTSLTWLHYYNLAQK